MPQTNLSRRDALLILAGIGGVGTVCACTGVAGLLWLAGRNRVTATPTQTPVPLVVATPTGVPVASPKIIPRAVWGAKPPNHNAPYERGFFTESNPEGWYKYPEPLSDHYQTVIIHHSAMYERDDLTTLLEIDFVHRQQRGWADIAYHYLIGKDGTIFEGRDIHARGVHVQGYNNGSVGVCLLGDFTRERPTPDQLTSTRLVVRWLADWLTLTHIAGHKDFNPSLTECPGPYLAEILPALASDSGLILGTEGYVPPPEASSRNTVTQIG